MLPLILCSASKSKASILTRSGLPFEITPSNLDESTITSANINTRVIELAKAKVSMVAKIKHKPAWLLATDTVVIHNLKVLEKPKFKMTAMEMLINLSGNSHKVITGWALLNTKQNLLTTGLSETKVYFRQLNHQEIENYVNDNPVTSWAGGYNAECSSAITFIDKIEGSLTGLNGLPLDQILPVINKS